MCPVPAQNLVPAYSASPLTDAWSGVAGELAAPTAFPACSASVRTALTPPQEVTLAEARLYCARMAKASRESFLVTTWFCPRELRQHFYNLYCFTRIADDLADEVEDPMEALRLLNAWEAELDAMERGVPRHPIFVALAETVSLYSLPCELFHELIAAYRQDLTTQRYATFADLLNYCNGSFRPIGRMILHLCGYHDPERMALMDLCWIGIQLTDMWHDVVQDLEKGRIYLPQEDMERFGCTEAMLRERRCTPEFTMLMRFQVERTRTMFAEGQRVCDLVDRRVRLDIAMYNQSALEVLRLIEQQDYDVLTRRPKVSKARLLALLLHRFLSGLR